MMSRLFNHGARVTFIERLLASGVGAAMATVAAVGVGVGAGVGCGGEAKPGDAAAADAGAGAGAGAEAGAANTPKPVNVRTVVLAPTAFHENETLRAVVEPWKAMTVSAETMGVVETIGPDEGAMVGRGATLARIDSRTAEASLKQAEASLALAKANFGRVSQLFEKGLGTQADLDTARASLDQATAGHTQATLQFEKSVVTSEFAGYVAKRHVEKGELVSPGTPLYRIIDTHKVKVVADVPERIVREAVVGAKLPVKFDVFGDEVFEGEVVRVALEGNNVNRTFATEIAVANDDRRIRAGMMATVAMARRRNDAAIVVPRDAVIDDVDGKFVFVVGGREGQTVAQRRDVQVGGSSGRWALVSEGLTAGDEVVAVGQRLVVHGTTVTVTGKEPCCGEEIDAARGETTAQATPPAAGAAAGAGAGATAGAVAN